MSIKITVADLVRFKVAGTIADASGPQPFDFTLIAKRLDTEALRAALDDDSVQVVDFLASVITDWQGVKGDAGVIEYSAEALRQLMLIPGLAALTLRTYLVEVGARGKN